MCTEYLYYYRLGAERAGCKLHGRRLFVHSPYLISWTSIRMEFKDERLRDLLQIVKIQTAWVWAF